MNAPTPTQTHLHSFTLKMRFFTIAVAALSMGNALAAPAPQAADTADLKSVSITGKKVDGLLVIEPEPVEAGLEARTLQKRGPVAILVGVAGTAIAARVAQIAIEIASDTIKNLGKWNEAREAFTKKTTAEMWARNPNRARFPAVVCYNQGYSLQNPSNIDGKADVDFKLGALNTEYVPLLKLRDNADIDSYDCMYIGAPNQFYTQGHGGYINLSYSYDGNRCSFDQATGDLTCR
ncbi:hypothetical protein HJFPF1_07646 [Paramyrothecium foliicola]|nr:hypothetical protein HJFPF1_07646 [Paramyrothecium foliicola]